jgi:hypothetical protein
MAEDPFKTETSSNPLAPPSGGDGGLGGGDDVETGPPTRQQHAALKARDVETLERGGGGTQGCFNCLTLYDSWVALGVKVSMVCQWVCQQSVSSLSDVCQQSVSLSFSRKNVVCQ